MDNYNSHKIHNLNLDQLVSFINLILEEIEKSDDRCKKALYKNA